MTHKAGNSLRIIINYKKIYYAGNAFFTTIPNDQNLKYREASNQY